MAVRNKNVVDLPTDVLSLILEQLISDSQTLSTFSRTSKAWHSLCLPFLLNTVDLSCHNLGRQMEWESDTLLDYTIVESDYADRFRPRNNIVSRQRTFLRLLTDKPELAPYVRSFTWTLIWYDFDEYDLASIDLQTWNVFQRLTRVTKLDLASLHEIGDESYIRQNPTRLFPAVVNLRLVGWMHRGLVKAILASLDATKLRSLELDHLQDEGTLPDGRPMEADVNLKFAESVHNRGAASVYDEEEAGEVCTFPGPMWHALRVLRNRSIDSLEKLTIRLVAFDCQIDIRNYFTMFEEIEKLIVSARDSLRSLTIAQGESAWLHCADSELANTCGTSRVRLKHTYRPWCFNITTSFLSKLLCALTEHTYSRLADVHLEGFRILGNGRSQWTRTPNPATIFAMIEACPFIDLSSIETANIDRRQAFTGYDYLTGEEVARVTALIQAS